MSNFNVTTPHPARSAISLGGEWTRRDKAEANKYKSALYNHVKQRRARNERKNEEFRPKSTPGIFLPSADCADSRQHTPPPKSAPPGSKPRCDRFHEVDQWAGRRSLTPHLKMKKSPRNHSQDESPPQASHEYSLGSGMTMTKSKNGLAVTIDTGLSMSPPPRPEILQQTPDSGDNNTDRFSPGGFGQTNAADLRRVLLGRSGVASADGASRFPPAVLTGHNLKSALYSTDPGTLSHESSEGSKIVSGDSRRACSAGFSRISPAVSSGHWPNTALYASDPGTLHESTPHSSSISPYASPSEALIAQLQQQVADLTLYLGEERLNHKSTKEKAVVVMQERLQELDSKHMGRYRQMQEDYEDKMDVMKQIHAKEKEHQKRTLDAQIAKLKGELEFLQGAFDAYKKTLIQDMEEKWSKKEQDLRHKLQEEMDAALHQQRIEMLEEKNIEKNSMSRELNKQIEDMDMEHRKEIESMMKKFSSASSDVENLRRALDQLKAVRDELDQTVERLAVTEELLQETKEELQDANLKILNFQDNFQNRVNEVDSKHKDKMDHVLQENAELRKRYIAKCGELFSEKSNTEYKRVEKIASTKELLQMIVHTKNRANVNMASGDQRRVGHTPSRLHRPTSAPSTNRESRSAFQNAGNVERCPIQGRERKYDSRCPQTTSPSRRKLNRESLHETSFRTLKESSLQPP